MASSVLHVAPEFQPVFREVGIDADEIFRHALIKPWRTLPDRENCTLDATLRDGRVIRWHVKRYTPVKGSMTPADNEVNGQRALSAEKIPTASLVAYGKLEDGRSFVIFDDLTGYQDAEKLVQSGTPFDRILAPTADLAAKLHGAGLHHRDLYLCHFFAKVEEDKIDVRLIDTARVKRLPGFFTHVRWIVKDLAQFWYSTTNLPITDQQRMEWLKRYGEERGLASIIPLKNKILRKVEWIGKHDAELRKQQPNRNISIPK